MKHSDLLLALTFLSRATIHAFPAPSENEGIARRGFWDSTIPTWFGFGDDDDDRVVHLGWRECESDPYWRHRGWCEKNGPDFPKDGGRTPNPSDPIHLPAIPGFQGPELDVHPTAFEPLDLDHLKHSPEAAPSPGDPTVQKDPASERKDHGTSDGGKALGEGGKDSNDSNDEGRTASGEPGGTAPGAIEYVLPDGGVYTSPPGLPTTWTRNQMQDYYNHVCITDELALVNSGTPPRAPLLDAAGWERCDEVEGQLYDEADEMAEAQQMAKDAEAANEQAEDATYDGPNHFLPGDMFPDNNLPENMMMSGGLPAGTDAVSFNTMDFINGSPAWRRGYRRMARKFNQWVRRRNANGFFDPESARGMNYAFGLDNDPILSGPGLGADPSVVRPTELEKTMEGIKAIASLPNVPCILPPGYEWVPAEVAEFGDNWEHVKRLAEIMGRDPLQKAVPERVKFKMPWGNKGVDYTPRVMALYGMTGSMITPEVYAKMAWRIQHWLRYGKINHPDFPFWMRDLYIDPGNKLIKKVLKNTGQYIALFGIIGAAWGIILGVHAAHDKKMEKLGAPFQKFTEPIKEGYGPWIITESAYTTTIDGTAHVSTITEYTQYFPGSTEKLAPSEIAAQFWPSITFSPATVDGGSMTVPNAAAEMTAAALPEYAGIARLPPSTANVPATTGIRDDQASPTPAAKPSPKAPPLNYVEPDRLLHLGFPLDLVDDTVEVDNVHQPIPLLPTRSDLPFIWPTRRPRPPMIQGIYTNNTNNGTSNSTKSIPSASTNSSAERPRLNDGVDRQINDTAITFSSNLPKIAKAPHNVTTVPYGLPNATSSFDGYGYANSMQKIVNSTYAHKNSTTKPKGQVRYLKGTAPWDGAVLPEIPVLGPTGDGKWMCQWTPSEP